jgi:4-hydroxy-tetrahydrodipicolinate synthase
MLKSKTFKKYPGVVVPVVTVFDSQSEIDENLTKKFIQHLIKQGIHGLFIGGTTGEFSLMTLEQKKSIVRIGVEAANGKIPVIAGVGDNSTRIAIELSKEAEKSGADGVLAFLPHYPKPNQEGLYEHYKAIAQAINIPVGVYNCPAQYGINMEPETLQRLVEEGYIQLIKDSVVDLDHTAEVVRLTEGKITVWTGYDTKVLAGLSLGVDGCVVTIANLIPNEIISIYNLFKEGKLIEARKKQFSIFPLTRAVFAREDMQLLKEAIKLSGYEVGNALKPASKASREQLEKIRVELKSLGK